MDKLIIDRKSCTRCAVKHLGKAKILLDEMRLGYPTHVWIAAANLSEAEDEIIGIQPDDARSIRAERLKMEESLNLADVDSIYVPNLESLMMQVAENGLLPEVTL